MKKFLLLIFIFIFCLSGCKFNNTTNIQNTKINNSKEENQEIPQNNQDNQAEKIENEPPQETEISSFSTKIYTPNDSARQNNIKITCATLNETIVKPRRDFFIL